MRGCVAICMNVYKYLAQTVFAKTEQAFRSELSRYAWIEHSRRIAECNNFMLFVLKISNAFLVVLSKTFPSLTTYVLIFKIFVNIYKRISLFVA